MFLLIAIPVICLLLAIGTHIIKLINISRFIGDKSSVSTIELEEQLKQAKESLKRVKETPASGEYAQYVKTMRAEQKVIDLENNIRSTRTMSRLKSNSVDLMAGYVLKAVLSLVLFIISLRNRYTPVMVFNESFNLAPLTGLLSFPTGVANAVSVPMWVLSCNVTITFISQIIRKKI